MNQETLAYIRLTRQIWMASFAAILVTITIASFTWEALKNICICVANQMAYAWEAFGLTLIISTAILAIRAFCNSEKPSGLIKTLFYIQCISFIVGIFFLIYFGCRVTDVI